MTPIPESLREKWTKEANEKYNNSFQGKFIKREAYLAACEARHSEYSERIGQLEGLLREAKENIYENPGTINIIEKIDTYFYEQAN